MAVRVVDELGPGVAMAIAAYYLVSVLPGRVSSATWFFCTLGTYGSLFYISVVDLCLRLAVFRCFGSVSEVV